jgi:hypothetical protein
MEPGPPATPHRSRTLARTLDFLGSPAVVEGLAVAALAASALFALVTSWRCWPDPIIDVGHQLYTAWRLGEGAMLYRDVNYLYGPLSPHINALLFRVFGAGMMVLVWTNLAIYAGILTLAYRLFRAAYGVLGAFSACAVFVWVFSFNQLVPVGNYTYALPYAHESSHGILITLAITGIAARWTSRNARRVQQACVLGLLCGLTVVLKPEFMLVGALVVGAATLLRIVRKRSLSFGEVIGFGLAASGPMTFFTLWFWRRLPFSAALRSANQAWWTILVSRVHTQIWDTFLGTDAPLHNLTSLLTATTILGAGMGAMWLGARRMSRGVPSAGMLVLLPCGLAVGLCDWMQIGWSLPLTLVAIVVLRTIQALRASSAAEPGGEARILGLLLATAALALLVRMFLHPRVYHYGFYQAALAAMVVVAEIVGVLRRAVNQHRAASLVTLASTGLVLLAACSGIFLRSHSLYAQRTFPVGIGRDQFLTFAPEREASGFLVEKVVEELRLRPAHDRTLVVPEGLMINYLARRQSPLAEWIFADLSLASGAETRLVAKLATHPPESVVLISRDLREYGITSFGAPGQPGSEMLDFFRQYYEPSHHFGGNPLDPQGQGAVILDRIPRVSR